MIDYPKLQEQRSACQVLNTFKGYNRNLQIGDGEFFAMENLTSDHYPVLSSRKKRRILREFSAEDGEGVVTGIADLGYKALVYTRGAKIFGIGSLDFTVDLGLDDKPKRLVSMGAYLIVWPDQKYINIQNPEEHGSLGHRVEISKGEVNFALCSADGELFGDAVIAKTAPKEPQDKALWIDTSTSPHTLKRYSETSSAWVSVLSTYIKISGLPDSCKGFGQYDGVRISGVTAVEDLNGWAVIQNEVSGGEIIIPGILDEAVTQDCADAAICIERKIPAMDFVIEAGNRLWGCRFGENAEGAAVNEIYASKLGDFKNWNCFMGISTDSWAGSVGSPGEFTGAVNLMGSPVFYKNDIKHKVWISGAGAHQVTSTPCQGVAFTCGDSLAVINGAAIYKSNRGFCVDDGSMPVEIGQCFAGAAYTDAVGCVSMNKYFVSMCGTDGAWHLFVYDMDRKLWHREDGLRAVAMCCGGSTVCAADPVSNRIIDLNSGTYEADKMEEPVRWMAETGDIGLSTPDMKYISRLMLRLFMEAGAELTVLAQYDNEEDWVELCSIQGTGLRSFSLPIRPRRCDHLRLRFEGEGDVKLYSIAKIIEEGSDIS